MVNIKLHNMLTEPYFVDCACLIHGDMYNWSYVDNLYSMLTRHLSFPIRLHVWTESHRQIPHHMIKHDLVEWPGVAGPKKLGGIKCKCLIQRYIRESYYT